MDERMQDRVWEHRQHLNDDFNNLSNYFLVAESLLLGVASAGLDEATPFLIKSVLGALGLLLTLVWMYVQGKQRSLLQAAKRQCESLFPEYQATRASRTGKVWRISNTLIMAYVMPGLFALTWFLFMVAWFK